MTRGHARRARIASRVAWVFVMISVCSATWGAVVDTLGGSPVMAQLWATFAVAELTGLTIWSSIMRHRIRALEDGES